MQCSSARGFNAFSRAVAFCTCEACSASGSRSHLLSRITSANSICEENTGGRHTKSVWRWVLPLICENMRSRHTAQCNSCDAMAHCSNHADMGISSSNTRQQVLILSLTVSGYQTHTPACCSVVHLRSVLGMLTCCEACTRGLIKAGYTADTSKRMGEPGTGATNIA